MSVIDGEESTMSGLDEVDLYKRCSVAAYETARVVLRSDDQAEEIAADAYLDLLAALRKGQPVMNAEQYVRKIAYRKADLERSRLEPLAELDEADLKGTVDSSGASLRLTALIRAAAERLTSAESQAVYLINGAGKTGDEAGEVMGIGRRAVYEQARVGRRKLERALVDRICQRAASPPGCPERAWSIYELITGKLDSSLRPELEDHLSECAYCRTSQTELALFRQLASLAPLYPVDRLLARKDELLRAAARRNAGQPTSSPSARWRLRLSLAIAITGIVAVLGLPGVINRPPPHPPAHAAAVTPQTPTPPPSPPTPPVPVGGFAYLKSGDVYYRSDFGAGAIQLTNTGGHVDDFYWAGSGRSIIYKETAPASEIGDLYQVNLVSNQVTWSFKAGAAALAVSPDGASYVAAVPVRGANGYFSYRLLLGSIGSDPDPAREVDLATSVNPNQITGYLSENPPVNWRANFGAGVEMWWTLAGIHLEAGLRAGYDVDPTSKAVVSRPLNNVFDAERAYSGPAISQIQLVYGNVQVTKNGVTTTINFVDRAGPATLLSVSADESRGLVTVGRSADGGHDVYLVTANGDVTPLSTDGTTLLAAWQPPITQ